MNNEAAFQKTSVLTLLLAVIIFGSWVSPAAAQFGSCNTSFGEAFLDINNVRARVLNNGNLFWRGSPNVYEVPKGDGANVLFFTGFWVGGFVDGQLRVAGARYSNPEFWSGPLDDVGNPPADCSIYDKLWKVSRADVQNYEAGNSPTPDLASWPTGLGAPTLVPADSDSVDNDGDGTIDEPGEMKAVTDEVLQLPFSQRSSRVIDLDSGERPELAADQMLWWIMNDRGNQHNATGSEPVGLEVHGSAFAFDTGGHLGNATIYKWRMFNRNAADLTAAYVAFYGDPDLGNFDDDYLGADTARGLVYAYNADNDDEGSGGYGAAPPAVAFTLLRGPNTDSDSIETGFTSFLSLAGGSGGNSSPNTAAEYYRTMMGLWPDSSVVRERGDGYAEDASAPVTTFMYPGDPTTGAFWSEFNTDEAGTPNVPADRRFVAGAGPFEIGSQERRDVVLGILWARGSSNLESISLLADAAAQLRSLYDVTTVSAAEGEFEAAALMITHVYPNPAWRTDVTVAYEVPKSGQLSVEMHDVLGRRLLRTVREVAVGRGTSRLEIAGMAAGVYFVRVVMGDAAVVRTLVVTR